MTRPEYGPTRRRTTSLVTGGLTLAVALGAAGCTSGGSKAASSGAMTSAAAVTSAAGGAPAAAAASSAAAAPMASGAAAAGSSAAASAAAPSAATAGGASSGGTSSSSGGSIENRPPFDTNPLTGRSIIYTGTINVQVPSAADVPKAIDQATSIVQAAGGYVFGSDEQAAPTAQPSAEPSASAAPSAAPVVTGTASADLTLKVPPAQYNDLLVRLGRIGTVLSSQTNAQDVTNQVVDTTARLTTMKESVARVRTLLDKATSIGQIVSIESELTRREADLESLEGQLNVLKAQTAMGTITLHLTSAPIPPKHKKKVVPPPPKPKKHIHGFLSGLKAGSRGFVTVAVGVATVIGAVLPFLATLLVVAVVAWLVWRSVRRSRHRPAPPAQQVVP